MPTDEQIALTLYNRMYEVIGGADPSSGLPSAFDSSTHRFVMAQRGLALNAADYRNPWSPGNQGGSVDAAAAIAALADQCPADDALYNPTGTTVSETYRKIVNGVHVTEPPPSPEMQATRDRLNAVLMEDATDEEGRPVKRPTALADGEQKAADAYKDAIGSYQAQFVAAQKDEALKGMWPVIGAQQLERPKRAFLDWATAGRDQIASTKSQLATLNEGQVARAFADAQFQLKGFELVNGMTETFYRTNISPTDWAADDGSSWPEYHFSSSTFDSEFSNEAHAWGGSANVQYGLWSFGGGVSHSDERQTMSQDTSNIGLSFKWRICPVYRKWMDYSLLRLPNWDLGSLAPQHGIAGGPGAIMPLIPLALVLVKDVTVTASFSHQDSEHIKEATSGSASVGWGPFAVSGNYSYSSEEGQFHAEATDQGFRVPTIQVLGFVCLRTPACPPR